jgi:hypothetical protein
VRFASVVEETFVTVRWRIVLRVVMISIVILLVFGGIVVVMWRGALAISKNIINNKTITTFILTN